MLVIKRQIDDRVWLVLGKPTLELLRLPALRRTLNGIDGDKFCCRQAQYRLPQQGVCA